MQTFRFYHPIEVRYGDLDPQGHVNNAKFLTYFEQARVHSLIHLGLFTKDQSFLEIGIILAEARVTYLSPVNYEMQVQVGASTTRLGNKSIEMVYSLQDRQSGKEAATGSATLVTYDYQDKKPVIIPEDWRKTIAAFENIKPPISHQEQV